MFINITVRYRSDHNGRGTLRATVGGNIARRQVTIDYPDELCAGNKHYAAARKLEAKLQNENDWNLHLVWRTAEQDVESTFRYEVFDKSVRRFDNESAVRFGRYPARFMPSQEPMIEYEV